MADRAPIPVLSLSAITEPHLSRALGRSFRDYGFAIVGDHGIADSLIDEGWRLTTALFALPDDEKRRYHVTGGAGQRGYTPFGREVAKGATVHDLKEFWHIGREPSGDTSSASGMPPNIMPPNMWPDGLEGFRDCFIALYREFERVGARILSSLALHLGLSPEWFDAPTRQGNSILRLLHYPPLGGTDDAASGAIRAGAHEDINLITLLLGAEEAGLQLRDANGTWLDVNPPGGCLVVNIGDMLQRLTNGVLPSTTHRVVNPPASRANKSRYSMPFFLHLRPNFVIEPLPQCIGENSPSRYAPISANDYLRERLREIGLLRAD